MEHILRVSRNILCTIAFVVVTCSFSFAQLPETVIEHYRQQIEASGQVIKTWQLQAHLQVAFVLAVILFGALITIFQGLNKGWTKPATLVLGACTTILTGVNAKVFPADYRMLQQSIIDGRDLVDKMNSIADNLSLPQADVAGLQGQWFATRTQFSGLQKAVLKGTSTAAALQLWDGTVYAQSNAPAWITHPPADADNLYFVGTAEDRSLTAARQQSYDNAVAAGTAKLSGNTTDCEPLKRIIASAAATDKDYFKFDKGKGVYRYYTLLRVSSDIKNLHVSCTE